MSQESGQKDNKVRIPSGDKSTQDSKKGRASKFILNILINGVLPVILLYVLKKYVTTTVALAIAASLPM
ncbi:1964_t:CDS:1, partial [Cetraspora pellucida]